MNPLNLTIACYVCQPSGVDVDVDVDATLFLRCRFPTSERENEWPEWYY